MLGSLPKVKGAIPFLAQKNMLTKKLINSLKILLEILKNYVIKKIKMVTSIYHVKKEINNKNIMYLISFIVSTFFFKIIHNHPITPGDLAELSVIIDNYKQLIKPVLNFKFYNDFNYTLYFQRKMYVGLLNNFFNPVFKGLNDVCHDRNVYITRLDALKQGLDHLRNINEIFYAGLDVINHNGVEKFMPKPNQSGLKLVPYENFMYFGILLDSIQDSVEFYSKIRDINAKILVNNTGQNLDMTRKWDGNSIKNLFDKRFENPNKTLVYNITGGILVGITAYCMYKNFDIIHFKEILK